MSTSIAVLNECVNAKIRVEKLMLNTNAIFCTKFDLYYHIEGHYMRTCITGCILPCSIGILKLLAIFSILSSPITELLVSVEFITKSGGYQWEEANY